MEAKKTGALRVLIVDDEPLARERVRRFLSESPEVAIIGECSTGLEAAGVIDLERPDIAFLDIQMPGQNGLEMLAALPSEQRPAVIIVTAHGEFAVGAFAEQVVDFLLKPFDRERFQLALKRAIDRVAHQRAGDFETRMKGLLSGAASPKSERIAVKADGSVHFLKSAEIVWVEAANNYCILHLISSKRLILRETMHSLERRLGAAEFARINRSALVNVDQVRELLPAKYGDYTVVLRNGMRLPLSRKQRGLFEKRVTRTP
jgi:two-component system LytT family response regulator